MDEALHIHFFPTTTSTGAHSHNLAATTFVLLSTGVYTLENFELGIGGTYPTVFLLSHHIFFSGDNSRFIFEGDKLLTCFRQRPHR